MSTTIARDAVHVAFKTTISRGSVAPFCCMLQGDHKCGELCNLLTAELAGRIADASALRELLGRWMFWASGVTFRSEYGEAVIRDTDAALGKAA